MTVKPVLAKSAQDFPNFKPRTEISVLFLEHNEHLLMLMRSHKEDQPGVWGIPGGKAEKNETPKQTLTRELKEETKLQIKDDQLSYHGHRYARIPGWDYVMHIYQAKLDEKPVIQIDPKEHSQYEWVSIYAFKTLPLLKGQDEAFDLIYGDRVWQKIDPKDHPEVQKVDKAASLVFKKGNQFLTFDADRKFILNLIGTSGSGKGTQGDMLSQIYGIPNISAGDIFRDEFRAKSKLGWMVQSFDNHFYPAYLPDEIPIGMMVKRLFQKDCKNGFILDGFPRTKAQGDATREVILKSKDFHVPLFMDVPESDIWERLPGRCICPSCGHQVRKFDENPWPGFCPKEAKDGKMVKLEHRAEDIDRSKIERRLSMFSENKVDILRSLAKRDPVETYPLNNKIPPREVLHSLCKEIQRRLDHHAEKQNQSDSSSGAQSPKKLQDAALLTLTMLTSYIAGSRFPLRFVR